MLKKLYFPSRRRSTQSNNEENQERRMQSHDERRTQERSSVSQPVSPLARYFNLQAMFAVEAYDLQVMADPTQYSGYMETPQT